MHTGELCSAGVLGRHRASHAAPAVGAAHIVVLRLLVLRPMRVGHLGGQQRVILALHGQRVVLGERLAVRVSHHHVAVVVCGGALLHIVRVVVASVGAVPLGLAHSRTRILQRQACTLQNPAGGWPSEHLAKDRRVASQQRTAERETWQNWCIVRSWGLLWSRGRSMKASAGHTM